MGTSSSVHPAFRHLLQILLLLDLLSFCTSPVWRYHRHASPIAQYRVSAKLISVVGAGRTYQGQEPAPRLLSLSSAVSFYGTDRESRGVCDWRTERRACLISSTGEGIYFLRAKPALAPPRVYVEGHHHVALEDLVRASAT